MNEYDSGMMARVLKCAFGLRLVDRPEDADVILINTCSVREKAEEKVYSELGRYRQLKENNPDLIIGVGGCVAQQEQERIRQRAPFVDLIFGPQSYHRLPEMVRSLRRSRVAQMDCSMPEIEKFDRIPIEKGNRKVSAYVTVMEGCDKFCTFCVVPYTRGPEISRPVEDIVQECRKLAEGGVVEVTLLGQNVNAYKGNGPDGEEWDLSMLIDAVAEIDGINRIRFTTSHPLEMTPTLMEAFRDNPKLMPYLHLPVQSGSNRILRAMHRGHTREQYLEIIKTLRGMREDIALSTDIIVGFPGETEEDFSMTLALIDEVGFDSAFCFKYSPRPGTPAARMRDTVPETVKKERLQRLLQKVQAHTAAALERQVGKVCEVLVEGPGRRQGDVQGRTPDFKIVHFQGGEEFVGNMVNVRITRAYAQSLRGELLA